METVKLNNGVDMPIIGYGVFKVDPKEAARWVEDAISVGIIVIPKFTHKERMEQNLDMFDFQLAVEDMKKIATLNEADHGTVNFDDPKFIKWLADTYKYSILLDYPSLRMSEEPKRLPITFL